MSCRRVVVGTASRKKKDGLFFVMILGFSILTIYNGFQPAALMLKRIATPTAMQSSQRKVRQQEQEIEEVRKNKIPLELLLDGMGTWDPYSNSSHSNIRGSTTEDDGKERISKIVWLKWNTHKLHPLVEEHIDTMKRKNPTYEFRLVNETEADSMIRDHFPAVVYETYQSINPKLGAARGDFWRYCVLFLYGGVYIDMDAEILVPLEKFYTGDSALISFNHKLHNICKANTKCHCHGIWDALGLEAHPKVLTRTNKGNGEGEEYIIAQWAMAFPRPYNPVLKEVILYMMIILHRWDERNLLLKSNFGMQSKVLCVTGPGMWTVAIARAFEKYDASYLKTEFANEPNFQGNILHPNKIIPNILKQQHKRYTDYGRSYPFTVGNGTSTKLDEGDYFQQASLPGLKKQRIG